MSTFFKKILKEPLFYLLPLLIILYIAVIPERMEISDVKVTRAGNEESVKLPYSFKGEKNEVFFVNFNLFIDNYSAAKLNITADDCIQEVLVNGKIFPLKGIKGLCDYSAGAYFDFSKYVQKGLNSFEVRIKNNGGPGGMQIQTIYNGFKSLSLMHYVFTLTLLLYISLILKKFKFKFIAICIILLGIIARLIVYTDMGPLQSPYDVVQHFEYINILAEEKRIPKKDECWECFQPPTYYLVSAALKNIVDVYDPVLTGRILQQMQLLVSFASIAFGVAFILNLLGNHRLAYLASIVSVFWTGFVVAAPRISNDIGFYFGALFCMLFAQRYWKTSKSLYIFLATFGAAVAIAFKSTGVIILAAWSVIYFLSVIRFFKIGSLRTLIASVFVIVFFIGISNHRMIVDIFNGKKVEMVGNISGLSSALKVNNAVGNYLYFDFKDYLLMPNASAWKDEGGRQYFWNYALKSSLYLSEKNDLLNFAAGRALATALCIFALLVFVLAFWGIVHSNGKDFVPLIFTIFLFAALICYRILHPYSCNNEFRFIFPVIFPISYFSVRGAQILQNKRLRILGYAAMLAFSILSFLSVIAMVA